MEQLASGRARRENQILTIERQERQRKLHPRKYTKEPKVHGGHGLEELQAVLDGFTTQLGRSRGARRCCGITVEVGLHGLTLTLSGETCFWECYGEKNRLQDKQDEGQGSRCCINVEFQALNNVRWKRSGSKIRSYRWPDTETDGEGDPNRRQRFAAIRSRSDVGQDGCRELDVAFAQPPIIRDST